jgi:hypothetical protein
LLHPPAPPQPDPKVQIEALKAKNEQDANAQKAQLAQQQALHDAQHQVVKTQAEMALQREKAQLEKELALVEAELKRQDDVRKSALHEQQMRHNEIEHGHRVATMQLGNEKTSTDIKNSKDKQTERAAKGQKSDETKGLVVASHDLILKALSDHAAALQQDRMPRSKWFGMTPARLSGS